MVSESGREYIKIDDKTFLLKETKQMSANITVDMILQQKQELETRLNLINTMISEMKQKGATFPGE